VTSVQVLTALERVVVGVLSQERNTVTEEMKGRGSAQMQSDTKGTGSRARRLPRSRQRQHAEARAVVEADSFGARATARPVLIWVISLKFVDQRPDRRGVQRGNELTGDTGLGGVHEIVGERWAANGGEDARPKVRLGAVRRYEWLESHRRIIPGDRDDRSVDGLPNSREGNAENNYYGPLYASYPNYGNVAPEGLGDCTFAAAAHWEQIVHGASPDPTVIGYEFAAAGGTASGGLTAQALFSYWIQQGIAGIRATGFTRYFTDKTNVENGVRSYGAMLVEFQFVAGTGFGQYAIANTSRHMAVVDGFTPEGPLVVTWGQTLQLTWDQWNAEVVGMYGVATS
jgi:hypothetical protein